ncbi:MAG TPA: MGMT family protein [Candidatus Melainabacteria bacterium]|jgi:methylated-DNA-protein-cysteine methyltransferase related protein|nr:MGMT family protein [Candidatus Melainabacteria bacterium]HIN67023.1 MGMT family protein [Candidatus Obscuribacterales bacterium]
MTLPAKVKKSKNLSPFEHVYEIVRKIPRGKVCTYGEISRRMNKRLSAAAVGWAMNALGNEKTVSKYNSDNVPWHRVINSKGKLSTHHESAELGDDGRPFKLQRVLLEKEGVRFGRDESIDLNEFLWTE